MTGASASLRPSSRRPPAIRTTTRTASLSLSRPFTPSRESHPSSEYGVRASPASVLAYPHLTRMRRDACAAETGAGGFCGGIGECRGGGEQEGEERRRSESTTYPFPPPRQRRSVATHPHPGEVTAACTGVPRGDVAFSPRWSPFRAGGRSMYFCPSPFASDIRSAARRCTAFRLVISPGDYVCALQKSTTPAPIAMLPPLSRSVYRVLSSDLRR
ncbi:hypothetical protein K438DRAFT_1759213 [Mycena galopus ATCC 62051]|nr:hypothetical protein K438DRAFT_1759213 [Mycena galopus ATCC 62051]